MIPRLVPISAVMFALACHLALGDEPSAKTSKQLLSPPPVAFSAATIESKSKTEQKIELQLAISTEYEIYSEHAHEVFLLPLQIQLLDANLQPVESTISYPKPKRIPFDKELGGDYYVYDGKPKFVATCAVDAEVIYVRLFYHGYSKQGF